MASKLFGFVSTETAIFQSTSKAASNSDAEADAASVLVSRPSKLSVNVPLGAKHFINWISLTCPAVRGSSPAGQSTIVLFTFQKYMSRAILTYRAIKPAVPIVTNTPVKLVGVPDRLIQIFFSS